MPCGWARPAGTWPPPREFLAATTTLTVATGIVNMWQYEPHQVAASFQRVEERFPGRFLLGVGAGHPEVTQQYARPYDTLARYVDTLLEDGVPAGRLVLAALGAESAAAGRRAHRRCPPLPGDARLHRAGPEDPRPATAAGPGAEGRHQHRRRAGPRDRPLPGGKALPGPGQLPANLRRLGWTDADLSGGGSDALIDALVAHGSAAQVVARLTEHLDAGADHVSIQLLTAPGADPADGYRELAEAIQAR